MLLIIPILVALVAGVLGLDVSLEDTVRFELQIGTLRAIGSLDFEPDYCPHTISSSQQMTATIAPSTKIPMNTPPTNVDAGEPSNTQRIPRTVIQTVFVTVTKSTPRPTTPLTSISSVGTIRTVVGTIGTLTGLRPSNPLGNVSFIRSPVPTEGLTVTSDTNTFSQRAWYYSTMLVIASSVLCI